MRNMSFVILIIFYAVPVYALDIALIVLNAGAPDANKDVPLRDHLQTSLGHTVTLKNDSDSSYDPTTYDCIVISESVTSGNTGWLKNRIVPILTIEGCNNDEYELASTGVSDTTADTDVDIVDDTHYIAAGLSGTVTAYTVAANIGYMSGWANDVKPIARFNAAPTQATVLYVEKGGLLRGGVNTAAERRVFVAAQYFNNLGANGVSLFNAALEWATYQDSQPASQSGMVLKGVTLIGVELR